MTKETAQEVEKIGQGIMTIIGSSNLAPIEILGILSHISFQVSMRTHLLQSAQQQEAANAEKS